MNKLKRIGIAISLGIAIIGGVWLRHREQLFATSGLT